MFALIKDGAVAKYPYTATDARFDNPNISFPPNPDDAAMSAVGAMRVFFTTPPVPAQNQVVAETTPAFNAGSQRWEQVWTVRNKTAEELAAEAQALQESIVQAVQNRLDDFARTRKYDSVLSAVTYADSLVQKFRDEGQYMLSVRDQTWARLYEILAEVQAGTRPVPAGYEDIEADLPLLEWPA